MSLQPFRHYKVEPFVADGSLTGQEGLFVKHGTADDDVVVCDTEGEISLGLLVEGGADNKAVSVLRDGHDAAQCASATYTFQQPLMVGADGKVKAATAGNYVVAFSRETRAVASADDLQVELAATPFKLHA